MGLMLDAGALIALERGDPRVVSLLKRAEDRQETVVTPAPVLGQVWRSGSGRQAFLARALPGITVIPADDPACRAAGRLLGRSRTTDIVDALVVVLAAIGDEILTSDPGDLRHLVTALARPLTVTAV